MSKTEFNHGVTRNRGAHHNRADTIVFMTDDAAPAGKYLIGHLMGVFKQRGPQGGSVIMAHAYQLPDKGYLMAERYTRSLNYPEESCTKTKEDLECMGIKTSFASNACYAYDREKSWLQGESTTKTIFNEDTIFAGRAALQDDYVIAYMTEARVTHPHSYGRAVQLRRNSDLAAFQVGHPGVFVGVRSESEGIRLMRQTTGHLVKIRRPWLIPDVIVKSGFKYMGY